MVLLILAGLFALLFGRITITRGWSLRGKYARLSGVAMLLLAVPASLVVTFITAIAFPLSALQGGVQTMILNLVAIIVIALGINYPFVVWQRADQAGEQAGQVVAGASKRFAIVAVALVGVLVAAGGWFNFRGNSALQQVLSAERAGDSEGVKFGSKATAEECFQEGERRRQSEEDFLKQEEARNFLSSCVVSTEKGSELCKATFSVDQSASLNAWIKEQCSAAGVTDYSDCARYKSSITSACVRHGINNRT